MTRLRRVAGWLRRRVRARGYAGGAGSKRSPPVFTQPGGIAEAEIGKIGIPSNPIVDE